MKILIAPDKFKGSLSALEVCQAIGRGLKKGNAALEVLFHPMADGGDGSLEILSKHLTLNVQTVNTVDPFHRPIIAPYYTSKEAAFIEVASASGLVLLKEKERAPLLTSTFGTGKMMGDAIQKGFQRIFLFLGGSATNDGGMGIISALGGQFLDRQKKVLKPIGKNLAEVHFMTLDFPFDVKKLKITLLCDVTNPLFGPNGSAQVYAPQKGANQEQVAYLDQGLKHFSTLLYQQSGVAVSELPGSGAAGGIGAGLVALLGADLRSGFKVISDLTHLEQKIEAADIVISGEGKLDAQSLQGKVVSGIADLCEKYKKPLTLFVGKNDLPKEGRGRLLVEEVYAIAEYAQDLADAMANGADYLETMALQFGSKF